MDATIEKQIKSLEKENALLRDGLARLRKPIKYYQVYYDDTLFVTVVTTALEHIKETLAKADRMAKKREKEL